MVSFNRSNQIKPVKSTVVSRELRLLQAALAKTEVLIVDKNILDILECKEPGFHPLVVFNSWRVAFLNYDEKYLEGNIKMLEKHNETDEVFVLLNGKCKLLVAEGNDKPEKIYTVEMDPCKLYNVKKGVWHNLIAEPETVLLIVENADTSRGNTCYAEYDPTARIDY
jgi:ureidoglycolate hydrolase